jgi:hypothetical protein
MVEARLAISPFSSATHVPRITVPRALRPWPARDHRAAKWIDDERDRMGQRGRFGAGRSAGERDLFLPLQLVLGPLPRRASRERRDDSPSIAAGRSISMRCERCCPLAALEASLRTMAGMTGRSTGLSPSRI